MIRLFRTQEETIKEFANFLIKLIHESVNGQRNIHIALSGGNTPQLLFSELKNNFRDSVNWSFVHFFWGDERCVNSDNPESNYGIANKLFLNSINIPKENIHFINGEKEPEVEAKKYSDEIISCLPAKNNLPCFDIVILGLGNDGHTASIFPNQMELLGSDKICEVATHPETNQKRITLTGKVINNAKNVSFLIIGKNKSGVLREIISKKNNFKAYPASHINPIFGKLSWYLDSTAGQLL